MLRVQRCQLQKGHQLHGGACSVIGNYSAPKCQTCAYGRAQSKSCSTALNSKELCETVVSRSLRFPLSTEAVVDFPKL